MAGWTQLPLELRSLRPGAPGRVGDPLDAAAELVRALLQTCCCPRPRRSGSWRPGQLEQLSIRVGQSRLEVPEA